MSKQHVPAPIPLNEMIDGVKNSISSVFTKSDVLDILKRIEVKVTEPEFTEHEMEELIDHVRNTLGYISSDDIIDKDTAEFTIGDGNVFHWKILKLTLTTLKMKLKSQSVNGSTIMYFKCVCIVGTGIKLVPPY